MDVPELVREELGSETVEAGVNLGDDDVVCLTPTRTLLYRAEGLLSDETVEAYEHDVERLDVEEGRRKTKFVLEYVDGERAFSVPSNRETQILELLFEGILRAAGVVEPDERVQGAFRFSELALVVTDARVIKHIGAVVWSDDYEVYPFADLTGLSFERGSVATEVVVEVDGRPMRVKTPNGQAREVQRVIEDAAFDYHGVDSLADLNAMLAPEETGSDDATGSASGDIGLGDGIDPLVGGDEDVAIDEDDGAEAGAGAGVGDTGGRPDAVGEAGAEADVTGRQDREDQDRSQGRRRSRSPAGGEPSRTDREAGGRAAAGADGVDAAAVEEQLSELTTAVRKQNELLQKQQQTIKQLIEELRQGRG